jgi:hypothetical protein
LGKKLLNFRNHKIQKTQGKKKEDTFSILLGAIFHHVATILKVSGKLFFYQLLGMMAESAT